MRIEWSTFLFRLSPFLWPFPFSILLLSRWLCWCCWHLSTCWFVVVDAIRRSPYVFSENLLFALARFSGSSFFSALTAAAAAAVATSLFAHLCHRSQFIKICCFRLGTYRYFYFGYKLQHTYYCLSAIQTTRACGRMRDGISVSSILTFSRL